MAAAPRHRAGMTLIEILFVLVIFGGLLATLMASLLVSRTSYVSADAFVQVQQEARRAFDVMVKELREAGQVNNNVAIAVPGVQRLDFQIDRGYDAAACGGVCWGTENPAFPSGWVHYVLDAATPPAPRLMRCVTAGRLDPMPADFAGCRVLANHVSAALANSSFVYDHGNRIVTVRLQASLTSQQLPGGTIGTTPVPLMTQVRLRNT
ncbi:MAG: type II secretion system protein [Candidatus Omnitrophica bacterium]|nr:type II secretion system protein [Candidatus Omnitrophota bacterium]